MPKKKVWKTGRQVIELTSGQTYAVNDGPIVNAPLELKVDGEIHVDTWDARGYFSFEPTDQVFVADEVAPELSVVKSSNYFQTVPRPEGKPSTVDIGEFGGLNELSGKTGKIGYDLRYGGHMWRTADQEIRDADVVDPVEMGYRILRTYEMYWREMLTVEKLQTTGNDGLTTVAMTAASRLDASGANNKPGDFIETQMEAVYDRTGMRPNTMVLNRKSWRAMRRNAALIAEFNDVSVSTREPKRLTTANIEELFELDRVVVANATWFDGTVAHDFWGKDMYLLSVYGPPSGATLPSTIMNIVVADAYKLGTVAASDRLSVNHILNEWYRGCEFVDNKNGQRITGVIA